MTRLEIELGYALSDILSRSIELKNGNKNESMKFMYLEARIVEDVSHILSMFPELSNNLINAFKAEKEALYKEVAG